MKKNLKKGFTLVECVVAMAILVVMALLLSMLLTATVNLRNHNVKVENQIDDQVEAIAQKDALISEDVDAAKADIKIGGKTISGANAKKVYFGDSFDVQVGAIDYNIEGVNVGGDEGDPDESETPSETPDDEDDKVKYVYGALDISGKVKFLEIRDNSVNSRGMYPDYDSPVITAVWKVSFNPAGTASPGKGLKIVLPTGAKPVSYAIEMNYNCKVQDIGNGTIRFEPSEYGGIAYTSAYIEFQIDTNIYEYKTPEQLYGSNEVAKDSNI